MGKDLNFDKITAEINIIHTRFPDMKFGSIIQIALDEGMIGRNINLCNVNSKQIYKAIKNYKEKLFKKLI